MSLLEQQVDPSHGRPAVPMLSLSELSRRLHEADAAAFLALPRIVRRVIKFDADLIGLGLKVPHRKCYQINRQRLLDIVDPSELGLASATLLPPTVILISQPESDQFEQGPADQWLLRCWRLLLHARVHLAMRERVAAGALTMADVRRRVEQIGATAFGEIRSVLKREDFLLPEADGTAVYEEFAALYVELRYFAPSLLPTYFPAVEDFALVDAVLAEDIDAARLFAETRLAGAPDPVDQAGPDPEFVPPVTVTAKADAAPRREDQAQKLLRRAKKAASVGNVVRAAILRRQAAQWAAPRQAAAADRAAAADLDALVKRLQKALEVERGDPRPWRESLFALADQATRGIWTSEARLLYDLQKVCVDHEREIYTVDLVEWAVSRGELPIKRPLPSQREVLMCKHLRSAERRLAVVRISELQREQLGELIHTAALRAEEQLRHSFRPRVHAALDDVGLAPGNVPEKVARHKLVEELLDRIVDRGFLTMGDLRDALSRNNLKLPDCAGPSDFLRGDQLLQSDHRLGQALDGVYSRGEIYLRWMQRLSALAFGTKTGRFFTKYVAIPFGGAYVALAGLQHLIDGVADWTASHDAAIAVAGHAVAEPIKLKTPASVLMLGLFLLGLLHSSSFRASVVNFFQQTGRMARRVFVDAPLWVIRQPLVRAVLRSRPVVLGMRFIIKPLLFTALVGLFVPLGQASWETLGGGAAAVFLGMNLLLNSPLGRQAQEVVTDWLVQGWHRFGVRLLTGLFYLVMDLFKGVLETVERLLYTVDEWLRFKSGESNATLAIKAVLGVIWFFVTYVIRFCVNLLIEPQINPIKHFPVVTVSHKLLLPFIPALTSVLAITLDKVVAGTVATVIVTSIPGIFGFLVWELKENWRLYAANRPRRLQPVLIGSHGETLPRLLKPGFHSGTIPKLFARLRRAQRKARQGGNWKATRKHRLALEHVEQALRRFVERELAALLNTSSAWTAGTISIGKVLLATNQVRVELKQAGTDSQSMWLVFSQRSGWLLADIKQEGWIAQLTTAQRTVLHHALAGLYKYGGVEVVCQQVDRAFEPPLAAWDVSEGALITWTDPALKSATCYPLRDTDREPVLPAECATIARCDRSRVLFAQAKISWRRWVDTWQPPKATGAAHVELLTMVQLLPEASPRDDAKAVTFPAPGA